MLEQGTNWQHFPAESGTLLVCYAPVKVTPPLLPYYKTTAGVPTGRLLVNPGTNEFYQDCAEELRSIVADVASGYRETIHYGFSQGATGALDVGLSDPKCSAIFAMSPHLVLDRPSSRSAIMMSREVLCRSREDMLDRIRQCNDKDLHLFFSCLDVEDGVQVRDGRTLRGSKARLFFLLLDHVLQGVNAPEVVVPQYLATRNYELPVTAPVADVAAQREAMLVFDIWAANRERADLRPDVLEEMISVPNFRMAHALGHYFTGRKKFDQAAVHFIRACVLGRGSGKPTYDSMVCAGNVLAATGVNEVALGYYRQARKELPRREMAWRCEANLLSVLKRQGDLEALLASSIAARCNDDTVQAVKRRLAESA